MQKVLRAFYLAITGFSKLCPGLASKTDYFVSATLELALLALCSPEVVADQVGRDPEQPRTGIAVASVVAPTTRSASVGSVVLRGESRASNNRAGARDCE
jgi:hypothetical protein